MKMGRDAVEVFLETQFPQIYEGGRVYSVSSASPEGVVIDFEATDQHLRPGGTVSGPSIMALADIAAYAAVLSATGAHALAMTTSFNINFLKRALPGRLQAAARLLKAGRRLVVVEIDVSDPGADLVAHATATYIMPPDYEVK